MFGGWFGKEMKLPEGWKVLQSQEQLDEIIDKSNEKPQVLFKHSTRCSISSMAFNRLKSDWAKHNQNLDFYYLDLLNHRDVSNAIEKKLNVTHQSPQIIVLNKGKVIHHASHNAVGLSAVV